MLECLDARLLTVSEDNNEKGKQKTQKTCP